MEIKNNPERYARMAAPYANADEAREAMERFLDGPDRLREECRIPEVMVVAAARYTDATSRRVSAIHACQWGNSALTAELAAFGYQHYALPEIERARRLEALARADSPTLDPAKGGGEEE